LAARVQSPEGEKLILAALLGEWLVDYPIRLAASYLRYAESQRKFMQENEGFHLLDKDLEGNPRSKRDDGPGLLDRDFNGDRSRNEGRIGFGFADRLGAETGRGVDRLQHEIDQMDRILQPERNKDSSTDDKAKGSEEDGEDE